LDDSTPNGIERKKISKAGEQSGFWCKLERLGFRR
jgi:hypothetical protein